MKRFLLVLLCMGIALMPLYGAFAATDTDPTPKPSATPIPPKTLAIIEISGKDSVTVHDYFTKGKPVIGSIPNGEKVQLITFSPDGKYYRVLYSGGEKAGWVLAKYLRYVNE